MVVIICPVCIEPLVVNSDIPIVSPICGHAFHDKCLKNWLLEKSSCPTCRNKIKKDGIKRLFLESTTLPGGQPDDVASYVCQVESISFELKMKKKEVQDYKEKAIQDEEKKKALRDEISRLETKVRKAKSDYSDSVSAQQSMVREMRALRESLKEMDKLKGDVEEYKKLDTILFGTADAADSILKANDVDPDNLIMLVSSFKNAFEEAKQSVVKKDKIIQSLTTENLGLMSKVEDLTFQLSTHERVIDTYRKKLAIFNSASSSSSKHLEISASDFSPQQSPNQFESSASSSKSSDFPSPSLHSYKPLNPAKLKRKLDFSPVLNRKMKIVSSRLKRP